MIWNKGRATASGDEFSYLSQSDAVKVARAAKQKYQKFWGSTPTPPNSCTSLPFSAKINVKTDYPHPNTLNFWQVHLAIFGTRFKNWTLSWVIRFPHPVPFSFKSTFWSWSEELHWLEDGSETLRNQLLKKSAWLLHHMFCICFNAH